MKRILFTIFLIAGLNCTVAQIDTTMTAGNYADTLKAGRTSIIITPDYSPGSSFTITASTTSGTDTILVYTYTRNLADSSRKVLIDLTTGSPAQSIIITTTKKEFMIYDPTVFKMRLQTNGNVSTLFRVSRK